MRVSSKKCNLNLDFALGKNSPFSNLYCFLSFEDLVGQIDIKFKALPPDRAQLCLFDTNGIKNAHGKLFS